MGGGRGTEVMTATSAATTVGQEVQLDSIGTANKTLLPPTASRGSSGSDETFKSCPTYQERFADRERKLGGIRAQWRMHDEEAQESNCCYRRDVPVDDVVGPNGKRLPRMDRRAAAAAVGIPLPPPSPVSQPPASFGWLGRIFLQNACCAARNAASSGC